MTNFSFSHRLSLGNVFLNEFGHEIQQYRIKLLFHVILLEGCSAGGCFRASSNDVRGGSRMLDLKHPSSSIL